MVRLMPIRRLRERIAVGATSAPGGGRASPGGQAERGRMRSRDARAGRRVGQRLLLLLLLSVRDRVGLGGGGEGVPEFA